MTTQQPEALRLADTLDLAPENGIEPQTAEDAAAELRLQHTRIAELEARIKTMAEEHADELMVAHLDGRMRGRSTEPTGEYPALPEPFCNAHSDADSEWPDMFSADQMRAYVDADRASRAPADSGAAPSQQVIVDFAQVGTAGPFAVVDGRVSLPDATMQDLVHMLRPTFNAQAADSVLEDAARWKMAVLVDNEVMTHPEKRTHPAAAKAYMDAIHSGLDLTGAIDAARKQGANHD